MVSTSVARDPFPRPPLVAASLYLAARPPAEIYGETDVVRGNKPVSQELVLPYEMGQVGPAVAGARLTGAFGIEGSEVPAVPRVVEVEAASGGQGGAVAGQARREHAVEHIHPERDDLEDADRVPDPHKVPGFLRGQPGGRESQCLEHLLPRLAYRETPHSVAVETDLDRPPEALLPEIGIQPALHDPEERLITLLVCLLAPPSPPGGSPQRISVVLPARVGRRT